MMAHKKRGAFAGVKSVPCHLTEKKRHPYELPEEKKTWKNGKENILPILTPGDQREVAAPPPHLPRKAFP